MRFVALLRPSLRTRLPHETRRAIARWLAPLLALCVLAGAYAKAEHDTAFRHVRCAEHGELTHVGVGVGVGADGRGASGATTIGARLHQHSALDEQGPANAPEHEHCELLFAAADAVTHTFLAEAVAFTPPALREPLATPRIADAGRTLRLATAPKTSPPRG